MEMKEAYLCAILKCNRANLRPEWTPVNRRTLGEILWAARQDFFDFIVSLEVCRGITVRCYYLLFQVATLALIYAVHRGVHHIRGGMNACHVGSTSRGSKQPIMTARMVNEDSWISLPEEWPMPSILVVDLESVWIANFAGKTIRTINIQLR